MELKCVRLLLISKTSNRHKLYFNNKKIHKIRIFVIWGYVYLTLTFDLEKGHNLILSFDLKQVYAVAYLDEYKR